MCGWITFINSPHIQNFVGNKGLGAGLVAKITFETTVCSLFFINSLE